jgi:hypothetical protein
MAMDPSLVAVKDEREPRKSPIGVRATPTTQTSRGCRESSETGGAMEVTEEIMSLVWWQMRTIKLVLRLRGNEKERDHN